MTTEAGAGPRRNMQSRQKNRLQKRDEFIFGDSLKNYDSLPINVMKHENTAWEGGV